MKYKYDFKHTIYDGVFIIAFIVLWYIIERNFFPNIKAHYGTAIFAIVAYIVYAKEDKKKFIAFLDEHIQFNAFRIQGNTAGREIYVKYSNVTSIKAAMIPFYGPWYIKIKTNEYKKAIAVPRYFINHIEMFTTMCDKIKTANPDVEIDTRFLSYLEKHKKDQSREDRSGWHYD